ncbi:SRPBCC family protein [Arthrobacter jiangjiafuii]|uniref:SRPBCC family protein n=1 Tax=Arthrobacter jiangjiafuii TaxID=2817475 RepID=A0A975R077_9MICC|nr:SRPBCC family protein [Arthrobacter jiangjiafuii]MBP3045016.1 SRPBCC family protein [Arthrobacter jiangjiafuii]QWC10655.1 SRPBCC family protein [Arthrobacter jiangjiafuii]
MGKRAAGQIYVEIPIAADMDRLWQLSQDTGLHPRWDLRFTAIRPTRSEADGTQRFSYEFRLPFHTITGTGTSLGTRTGTDGHATSVLKFTTADALSPIGPGSGYWRYQPYDGGVRFSTGYTYQPGWGLLGTVLDARLIRPALGWATALSFDRLRLWAEQDLDPATARNAWLVDAATRTAGMGAAAALLTAAARNRSVTTVLAALPAAVALLAAVLRAPAGPRVPRAGRCLRSPTDRRNSQAPSHLATLPEPA